MSDSEDDQPDWDYGESKGAAVYGPCLDASHSKRIADLERENERLRECLKSQSTVLSRIDYLCGEPNDMEVSGYDVHCNEDAVLVAAKKLRANLEAAEALLVAKTRDGSTAYHRRINSEIADYFRSKEAK